MRLRSPLALSALMLTACFAPAYAQDSEISFKATQVVEGLYMLEGEGGFAGGNVGLSIGKDGVVLIDDGMPPFTPQLMAAIAKITKQPVDFLINTHAHGDHVGGNAAFAKTGTTIVAHEKLRDRLLKEGMPTPDGNAPAPKEALPVLTFTDAVTIHLNGREAHVFHVAEAHTDGDAVIHFPSDNVIHTGDAMFNKLFPFIDIDSGGSVEGYIAAQKKIHAMADDKTKIVPGHGPLATKKDLAAAIEMLETSYTRVIGLVDSDKTEAEILEANPLRGYHDVWNWGFITTERMTKTLIRAAAAR